MMGIIYHLHVSWWVFMITYDIDWIKKDMSELSKLKRSEGIKFGKESQKWIARQLHANQRRNPNNVNVVQLRSVPSLPSASSIFHKHPSLSWSHSSNLLTISMDHESLDAQTPKTVQLSWFLDPTANKPQLAYKHVFWSLTAYLLQRDWHSTWPVPAERAFPANSAIVMKANLGSHLMSYSQSQEVHMSFRSVCN